MGRSGRPKGIACPKMIVEAIKTAGSQSKLARAIRLTRQCISSWKNGLTQPSEPAYRKLVRFLKRQQPRNIERQTRQRVRFQAELP